MTAPTIVPVILSGGSGTRLWPASRVHQPKQLLPLVGDHSLIGDTIARVIALGTVGDPIIVTNEAHAVGIERAMRAEGLDDVTLIIEPFGRNTAPAVAAAAVEIVAAAPDALMLVLPSDHAIADVDAFQDALRHGAGLATAGHLVTFGIKPTAPETGFGYIRAGSAIDEHGWAVSEFVEKPDLDTAMTYVESGEYSWNSGMFLFTAATYLEELQRYRPDILGASSATVTASTRTPGRILLDAEAFARCPAESIDYAVMERTDRAAVIPIDPGWSDVGSWTALWRISDQDEDGNVIEGDVVVDGTSNSLVHSHDRLVAVAGLDGAVVVDTPDAVLVTTLDASQRVKSVVDTLNDRGRVETTASDWQPMPWGTVTATTHVPGLHSWILAVDPASATDERSDEGSVFIRLISGSGTVEVGGETFTPDRRRAIIVAPGDRWSIANTGGGDLRVSVVRVDTVVGESPIEEGP